jgi:hypothetical protein
VQTAAHFVSESLQTEVLMHTTHISSGGRYPVLRTIAILYLVGSLAVLAIGVWRAVNVLVYGQEMGYDVFGVTTNLSGRLLAAACWIGTSLLGVLGMFAIAELIKLFIDIEHNTRMFFSRAEAATTGDVIVASDPATGTTAVMTSSAPVDAKLVGTTGNGTGGRVGQWLEGEETAEGALLRGH